MKFYETKRFAVLAVEWREKLKNDGFEDCEDDHERLKFHNRRTIAFDSRDRISEFFSALGHFLAHKKKIPSRDRMILELYSEGIWTTEISKILDLSLSTIRNTIRKYRDSIGAP